MGSMLILHFRGRHELQRYGQFPGSRASGTIGTSIGLGLGKDWSIQYMFSLHVGFPYSSTVDSVRF